MKNFARTLRNLDRKLFLALFRLKWPPLTVVLRLFTVLGSAGALWGFFAAAAFPLTGFRLPNLLVPWAAVAGLIAGGLITAPIAARFAGRAPVHSLGTLVGGMVIISNLAVLFRLFGVPGALAGSAAAGVALGVIVLAWRVHRMDVKPGEKPAARQRVGEPA